MIDPELVKKHIGRLTEIMVSGYTRHSKTGKVYTVAQYERQLSALQKAYKRTRVRAQNTAYQSTHGSSNSTEHDRLVKALGRLNDAMAVTQTNLSIARQRALVSRPKGYGYTIGDQVFRHGQGR